MPNFYLDYLFSSFLSCSVWIPLPEVFLSVGTHLRKEPWWIPWVYRVRLFQLFWAFCPKPLQFQLLFSNWSTLLFTEYLVILGSFCSLISLTPCCFPLCWFAQLLIALMSCGFSVLFPSCLYMGVYEDALSYSFVFNVIQGLPWWLSWWRKPTIPEAQFWSLG